MMKWKKINDGSGCLGQGYKCGDYIIEETFDSYNLQRQHGGRKSDYYWKLTRLDIIIGDKIIKYANTAKALKAFAEEYEANLGQGIYQFLKDDH